MTQGLDLACRLGVEHPGFQLQVKRKNGYELAMNRFRLEIRRFLILRTAGLKQPSNSAGKKSNHF